MNRNPRWFAKGSSFEAIRHQQPRNSIWPCFCALLLLFCLGLGADLRADTLSGTVNDPQGLPVAGARVDISGSNNLAQPITLTTDQTGKFTAPDLKPGTYTVRVTKDKFQPLVTSVELHGTADLPMTVDISMDACADPANFIPAATKTILEQADTFELLSLEPVFHGRHVKGSFHGYKILGSIAIQDASTRKKLVQELEGGVAENDCGISMCFNPRHAIRVTRAKKYADFVICFECGRIEIYGVAAGAIRISGSPQSAFDRALVDAKVPLATR